MIEQHIKEQISRAYAKAVAAHAGIVLREFEGTDYGLDGHFADVDYDKNNRRYSETGFRIDFQIKATTNITPKNGCLLYDLEVKNYRDLIRTDIGNPRILIVYSMPKEKSEWLVLTDSEATLKRCAWWCSLRGLEDTDNRTKRRIAIPDKQRLTPEELRRLVDCVKGGVMF